MSKWRDVPLGGLLSEDSRNGYARKPDGDPNGTPILKISAGTIRADGLVAEEEHRLISGVTPREREQYQLNRGDLLACRFNGNRDAVGRIAVFRDLLGLAPIYPDKLIRIRLDASQMLPDLVRWFSRSTPVRRRLLEHTATTVGNWGISAANLKQVVVPVPPLPEQLRIVAKIDELMGLCAALERSLSDAQTGRARALEAVLTDALGEAAA